MTRAILLLSILLFAAILSAPVLASDVITLTDVADVDGKIGLYIRNDIGLPMRTDNSQYNVSVLNYLIDGENFTSIPSKSEANIPTEATKLVVIDHAWPADGFSNITILFSDITGYTYSPESGYAFAKPGLEVTSISTDPKLITSNSSFTITLTLKADGEKDITNIRSEYHSHPKYYTFVSQNTPVKSLKKGESGEFSYTYKLSGQGMRETMVYETISVPVEVTYTYFNTHVKDILNETVVLYNKMQIGNNLPGMKALIDVPNTIVRGKTLDVSVFVWNSKADSHSACNLNLTFSEDSEIINIPISNVLPSDMEFDPASEQSTDPTATFEIEIPESASEGDYTLELHGTYKDCEWKAPGEFTFLKEFSVVKPTVIEEEPEAPLEAPEEQIDTVEVTEEKAVKHAVKTYLVWGVLLLAIVLVVVFLLEKRGRRI
jgi:hypothetical protein|tara:strand:+ start:845 stop:2143 length:1299 start_codon:yes stop_codon:yes gene_type:complete